jgi:hypothetical protein
MKKNPRKKNHPSRNTVITGVWKKKKTLVAA